MTAYKDVTHLLDRGHTLGIYTQPNGKALAIVVPSMTDAATHDVRRFHESSFSAGEWDLLIETVKHQCEARRA